MATIKLYDGTVLYKKYNLRINENIDNEKLDIIWVGLFFTAVQINARVIFLINFLMTRGYVIIDFGIRFESIDAFSQ